MSLIWHQCDGGLGPVEAQCPNGGQCWSIEAGVGEWVEAIKGARSRVQMSLPQHSSPAPGVCVIDSLTPHL